jgi:hypothetical protein
MRGTWEAYKSGNKHARQPTNGKTKPEEKQAFNAELKDMIRGHIRELLATEKRKDKEQFLLEDFNQLP